MIDADLRNPGMHRHLGTAQTPGLAEYLLGECDEFAALQRGPMENLFFHAGGPRRGASAPELLANGRLKLLLQRIEPLFDWIILDSAPVIPVSDATLVAGCLRWHSHGGALECDALGPGSPSARARNFPISCCWESCSTEPRPMTWRVPSTTMARP